MIKIQDLRALNTPDRILVTEHARNRLVERGIALKDIITCIEEGEIIEQYKLDKPFPSCLICGNNTNHEIIHTVISHDKEYLYLITAYYPDPEKWNPDFKTRREKL